MFLLFIAAILLLFLYGCMSNPVLMVTALVCTAIVAWVLNMFDDMDGEDK